ncbi:MAG: hypothetical protein HBSAPP01_26680 [Candidatus Brocadia sapporoensis]|nr:MAG: hypothetical protein HBSAPP01_26680 [Candidatus Brocadia sapporoensis]
MGQMSASVCYTSPYSPHFLEITQKIKVSCYRNMKKQRYSVITFLSVLFVINSCATKRPILSPNDHLTKIGVEAADKDIDDCIQLAKTNIGKYSTEKKIAEQTAMGAAVGAASGAAVGAIGGNVGWGAASGAAGGAAGGLIYGLFKARDPDPLLKQYIEKCLHEKGYDVIGWK